MPLVTPGWPQQGRDDVPTEPCGLAAIGHRKATAPVTKPLQLRPDTRSPAEKRIGDLLTTVISGRKNWIDLWALLQRYWPLAGAAVTDRRQQLFQRAITHAGRQDAAWKRSTPTHCGPSQRTALDHCTPRDQCGVHRDHGGLWMDFEHRMAAHLLHEIPELASADPAPKKARR